MWEKLSPKRKKKKQQHLLFVFKVITTPFLAWTLTWVSQKKISVHTTCLALASQKTSAKDRIAPQIYRFLRCKFHSAFATLISNSSSLTGIQLVSTFIAFSKSECSKMSRVPSTSAAEAAWRTSRPPLKDFGGVVVVGALLKVEVEGDAEGFFNFSGCELTPGSGDGSPRSMKTSQTRSWAGKGIE